MPSDELDEPKPSSAPRNRRDFDTTRLSLIRQAKQLDQQALAALCEVYWQPVYWFVRSRGAGRTWRSM
ncbi:MAG: hypothetical protein QM756_35090 [Polyangiaceae bacterium]